MELYSNGTIAVDNSKGDVDEKKLTKYMNDERVSLNEGKIHDNDILWSIFEYAFNDDDEFYGACSRLIKKFSEYSFSAWCVFSNSGSDEEYECEISYNAQKNEVIYTYSDKPMGADEFTAKYH